jgi:hypothetical protein
MRRSRRLAIVSCDTSLPALRAAVFHLCTLVLLAAFFPASHRQRRFRAETPRHGGSSFLRRWTCIGGAEKERLACVARLGTWRARQSSHETIQLLSVDVEVAWHVHTHARYYYPCALLLSICPITMHVRLYTSRVNKLWLYIARDSVSNFKPSSAGLSGAKSDTSWTS